MAMATAFSQSTIFLSFCFISLLLLPSKTTAQPKFSCSSDAICNALIDYILPNATTLAAVKDLFGVKNHRSILGANNLPRSTSQNHTLESGETIRIPFPCRCINGTGLSNRRPVYKVVPDDGLYHIAAEVFSGLVTFPQIQAVNGISDPNRIEIGQELWIPLPCSCDDVDGIKTVHYGHLVKSGNTVEGIAQMFNTSEATLLRLNGLASAGDLKADTVIDVPLKACTSMVSNNSLDYPLLVPNGTYIYTASNCITCSCDAANNWTLQCEPSELNSSKVQSCSPMQCEGSDLYIGNITESSNCNRTRCAYAGYANQTIFASLVSESICPAPGSNSSSRLEWQSLRWNWLLTAIHLLLLCLYCLS